jgi:glycosyltransferase involved in cell wall biosynthesis
MACGLPVLSTRVSAIPEVVVEGETGLLVPPGEDGPLADAMLRLARDPELRRAMGAAGRARVRERFGLERMVEETLAVYRELHRAEPPTS